MDNNDEYLLTTDDNPFNPFTDFDDWNRFDVSQGYNTCQYLDRIAKSSDDLSEASQEFAIATAINEIVNLNINGKYIKVNREYFSKQPVAINV